MRNKLKDLLRQGVIVADGATGSELSAKLPPSVPLDLAPLERPAELLALHAAYLKAGARLIQAHTFGASRPKLERAGHADRLEPLNHAAVKLAREAREMAGSAALVAGSIGSVRHYLPEGAPIAGPVAEQAALLEERGADCIVLETFPTLEELGEAVKAVRGATRLPLIAQMTLPDEWSEGPGPGFAELAERLAGLDADLVGLNCGKGPEEVEELLESVDLLPPLRFAFQPNAGVPVRREGRWFYPDSSPAYFGRFARLAAEKGAVLVGGCCGTGPAHIAEVARVLQGVMPRTEGARRRLVAVEQKAAPERPRPESRLYERLEAGEFVNVVQLDPPKGTNLSAFVELARRLHRRPDVAAVDVNANPLGRLHFDSLWMSQILQHETGIETVPHVTPRDMSIMGLESALLGAWAAGLRNLLVITGDPSQLGDYPGAFDVAQTDSVGLVRIIADLCRGLDWAGNPVGDPPRFALGVAVNPNAEDPGREIERFRRKLDHGAHFALSQVFFDFAAWDRFWDRFGGPSPVPVLVGIWPLSSFRLALRLEQEVPGIHVPEALLRELQEAGPDARKVGWDRARRLVERAREAARGTYLIAPYKQPEDILSLLD